VDVNVTLDLNNATFSGTTTFGSLAIANSATTIEGENNESLHFNNTNNYGYYAFHINNTPYFYIREDSCFVNNSLSINANEKQIIFYQDNNFWCYNASTNSTKLNIKSGTLLTN
jgi:hypothetical protein